MSETIVVTGASGYVGRHVVAAGLAAGKEVLAVSRSQDDWLSARLPESSIIRSSVFDLTEAEWERVGAADAVIHLAWRDGFALRARTHAQDLSSHWGFLVEAADRGVRRIAPIGTMHEIGYWEGAVGPETPSRPTTPYGIAKVALRELLSSTLVDTATEMAWLRCYYILGDDERSNSIFNKILGAVERGETEFPFTSGKNSYDFIPVQLLAQQILTAATAAGVTGVVECCSGRPQTLADAVEGYIRDRELPIRLSYGAFPDRPFDSPGIWGDATRIDQIMRDHASPNREESR